jgi:hypothetical protein
VGILEMIKQLIKKTPLYLPIRHLAFRMRQRSALKKWERDGRPVPPPHIVKQRILLDYARSSNLRVFVETGTCYGDMVYALKPYFDSIYSIEIDPGLFAIAKSRFKHSPHVHILHGDSGKELENVLRQISQPALFWLDGHYSGGETGRGAEDTPVLDELHYILTAEERRHVIIIDDARAFGVDPSYPTIEDLKLLIQLKRPGTSLTMENDSVRILL